MLLPVVSKADYEGLAEIVRAHYKETTDGNYSLDVDVREHPDTLSLRNAYEIVKGEAKEAKASLTKFDGIDPNEIATLKRTTELAQREKDLAEGNFNKALENGLTDINQKLALALKERDTLQSQVRSLAINDSVIRAVASKEGNPDLLIPVLLARASMDDKGRAFVKDSDGKPLLKKGWSNVDDYMSFDEHLEGLKADPNYAGAFKPNGATGGNAQQTKTNTQQHKGTLTESADGTLVFA